jgi:hypothetical protein
MASNGENTGSTAPSEPATSHSSERIVSPPSRPSRARGNEVSPSFGAARPSNQELMGPILKRKKVVSMPLGMGGDFFVHEEGPNVHFDGRRLPVERQVTPPTTRRAPRQKQDSFIEGLLRRKQVSLDLLGPNDFFASAPQEEMESLTPGPGLATIPSEAVLGFDEEADEEAEEEDKEEEVKEVKLFAPLRFAPRVMVAGGAGGGHGGGHGGAVCVAPSPIDEQTIDAMNDFSQANEVLRLQMSSLRNKLDDNQDDKVCQELLKVSENINKTHERIQEDEKILKARLLPAEVEAPPEEAANGVEGKDKDDDFSDAMDEDDGSVIRATRSDKIKAGILFLIMTAFTIFVCTWHTHIDEESFIHLPIGLACVTPCEGDTGSKDFFHGHHHHFKSKEVIQLIMHMDPNEEAANAGAFSVVEIVGYETGVVKAQVEMGPVDHEERKSFNENVLVDFEDPEEDHVINVYSSEGNDVLSFTLRASVNTPLANYSVLVAALIMIVVYAFILIEVIHRTLVAIFGSMIALLFLFIMQGGDTESIAQIMLNMEWSTLGLLFGMMLLVGELSHTGIFEWCAVRLLMASKGSFTRLLVLLCTLTAVASAFLDNVTTMLLVAPVTIDMCNILGVDPRPYLLGEIFLSNIGGTATLIGKCRICRQSVSFF